MKKSRYAFLIEDLVLEDYCEKPEILSGRKESERIRIHIDKETEEELFHDQIATGG